MAPPNASEDYLEIPLEIQPRIRICKGKACRKKKGCWEKLEKTMEKSDCRLSTVKCQGYCKGPVAVVERGGERFWFTRLREKADRKDLDAFIGGARLSKRLKRRLKKRR